MNLMSKGTSIALGIQREHMTSEDHLVAAAQAGSAVAFAELQTIYSFRLSRTISRITQNREDTEDALQDTFLRAYLAISKFEARSSVYSWLTRIAINSALMVIRKRRRVDAETFSMSFAGRHDEDAALEVEDTAPDPEQQFLQSEQRIELLGAIRKLEPKLRETLDIQLAGACSMQEIAVALGISVAAVKARLYRARRRLGGTHLLSHVRARVHNPQVRAVRWSA